MPFFRQRNKTIHYLVKGVGEPLLLLPAGGMDATMDWWERTAFNPIEAFSDEFRVIALDSRNAGLSTGPVDDEDPWAGYLSDHLGLLDHLGVARCHVLGCCIGAAHALRMAVSTPERVGGLVLEQPIGITDENQDYWRAEIDSWSRHVLARNMSADAGELQRFGERMWRRDFVASVDRAAVSACQTPMLLLPGIDRMHPPGISEEIAQLAPHIEIVQPWKVPSHHIPVAVERIRAFLRSNALEAGA